ncbi:MAG: hypothetical protein WCD38_03970, partial [Candidatus Tumulicola sp.]
MSYHDAMTKHFLALALALVALPCAALADPNDSAQAPSPLSPAQRQAMSGQIQAFRQKEMQMHQQLRSQILEAVSPDHRTAIADAIGQMVISASPDPAATAKQIDGVLSSGEQQRILSLHGAFVTQSQALMQQLHDQLARQGASSHGQWSNRPAHPMSMPGANDAGNVVLMVLAHRSPMMMGMPGMPGMRHG